MPRIQHKRGTSANLASVNPTPLAGELVWDSSENAIKIGDGATAWTSLAYVTATPRSHTHALSQLTDFSSPPGPVSNRSFLSYNQSSAVWSPSTNGGQINIGAFPLGGWPSGSIGEALAGKVDTSDARLSDARIPTAHKASHATGGSDALTPADIGAAPAVNPAITGNATFEASSGVPVTITNTGTGNSFVVNDASGDTTPFVVDSSGNIGIGGTPSSFIANWNQLIVGNGAATQGATIYSTTQGTLAFGDTATTGADGYRGYLAYVHGIDTMIIGASGSERFRANADGVKVTGVITVSATSGSAGSYLPSLTISGDANTGFGQVSGQSDTASVFTAGQERVRVRADGNVGIGSAGGSNAALWIQPTLSSASDRYGIYGRITGTTDSTSPIYTCSTFADLHSSASTSLAVNYQAIRPQLAAGASVTTAVGLLVQSSFTVATNNYGVQLSIGSGSGRWNIYADGTAANYFAGNVGIGASRTSPATALDVNGVITVAATSGSAGSYAPSLTFSGDQNTGFGQVSGQSDTASVFTAGEERVRVDASGRVGIGVTPTVSLHVKSSSGETLRLESTASGNGYVQFVNTSGSMSFGMTGAAANRVLLFDRINNQSAYDYLGGASGVHRFFTNDTHRMSVKATGAVRFVPLSADPASGEAGDVYYNSSTNKLRVYNGTSWVDLH